MPEVFNFALTPTQVGNLYAGNNYDGSSSYIAYDSKAIVGNWLNGSPDIRSRFADSSGSNQSIKTTFQNNFGSAQNLAFEVSL
jgi:hypothetical protein